MRCENFFCAIHNSRLSSFGNSKNCTLITENYAKLLFNKFLKSTIECFIGFTFFGFSGRSGYFLKRSCFIKLGAQYTILWFQYSLFAINIYFSSFRFKIFIIPETLKPRYSDFKLFPPKIKFNNKHICK